MMFAGATAVHRFTSQPEPNCLRLEQDGWNHLYSVATRAGRQLLSPGEVETEDVAPRGSQLLIYSSNQVTWMSGIFGSRGR
jgi:hypothetical protein